MRAQIKKEMLEAAYPVAVLFAGLCWAWLGMERFESVLIAPISARCLAVVGTAVAAGALIGFVQFAAERWRGTFGFAVHRSGGHSSLFAAKCIVGIAATLLLAIGPVFVFALVQLLFSVNAPILQSERLVEYSIYGLSGISGYALGALASQLRRGWWFDLSVLVLGSLSVFGVTVVTLWYAGGALLTALLGYLLVQIGVAVSLSSLALRLMRSARDRNLLLPRGQLAALSGVGVVCFLYPATIIAGGVVERVRQFILVEYPVIAQQTEGGELSVIKRGSRAIVDYDIDEYRGIRKAQPTSRVVYDPTWSIRGLIDSRPAEFPPRTSQPCALVPQWEPLREWSGFLNFESHGRRYSTTGFLDRDAGVVRVFWIDRGAASDLIFTHINQVPPTLPSEGVFTKEGGRGRFSRSTIQTKLDRDAWCVIDLEDRTMWMVDPTSFPVVLFELHLPDGDRLVRVEPYYSRSLLSLGLYSLYRDSLLFVGEKARYVWRKGQFENFAGKVTPDFVTNVPSGEPVPSSQAEALVTMRVHQTDSDPIHPRVEVRDARNEKVLFAHEYAPQTRTAKVEAALLCAGALLRMPIACLYSFIGSSDEKVDAKFLVGGVRGQEEPLLLRGRRPWLLLSNFAIAALCCASLVKRMKRHGADRMTIASGAAIVALFGAIAYVYFRGLMPKRASPAESSIPNAEARELLIQSA